MIAPPPSIRYDGIEVLLPTHPGEQYEARGPFGLNAWSDTAEEARDALLVLVEGYRGAALGGWLWALVSVIRKRRG